ncbi:hypothetical protein F0562_028425 [Nyssa sinensis]|uniref:Alanine--tRNA ligase n=1 Tax=Nyssa sinensis TaxID=561372 RepID=A0A5J5B2B5_9ASTE|nr:hypothetical protein F0562_028425 [Nyssa sinensis]
MEGLKLPYSLHGSHGGKSLVSFPTSTLVSRFQPKCNPPLSTGCRDYAGFIIRTLALIYPSRLPSKNSYLKGARELHFATRTSIQPTTEELVEDKSKDLATSGDSIRRRFLDFYASRGHKVLPSASLVPDDPTVLLTIAGMLQFKPIFLGRYLYLVPREVPCATTSQRCIRTNDVENVGRTARHHTFFEMLGNFSFGDYFKKEAIKWAWELTTSEFGLPANRLWVSVYEDDDEAFAIWHDQVGVPAERIKRMGEEDNFWTSGVTGPCGPCSEIYYDFYPERGHSDADLGDDIRFIEFYNLVFMQYNKRDDGSLEPLKQKNIDTGLGLERLARILQKVPNNYETDLIYPIIEKASELANVSYAFADDPTKLKLKIIGDHMRAIVYLLSDGVVPSNIGRGYVVRRLIRRAVRTGRKMELHLAYRAKMPFFCMTRTGFPVEITMEVADERGVSIDMKGFDVEMENQRRQSQAAHNAVKLSVGNGADLTENVPDTEFLGYDTLSTRAVVEGLLVNGNPVIQVSEGSEVEVLLNRTPFYAESGGQIGDHGLLFIPEAGNQQKAVIEIKDVQKSLGNIFVHKGTIMEGTIEVGKEVEAAVDANLRHRAKVHHTATHLLQAALKKVIGPETSQAGSLVAFDRLRFDFNFHRPLVDNELMEIEQLINRWIGDATLLQTKVMPLHDAKRAGAIAMFGEKYGEQVRVVEVPGVSMELCGGTHVINTSEIRGFKIISEQGIASGIRRIEAVAGEAFIEYVNARDSYMKQLCSTLKVKAEEVPVGASEKVRVLVECMDDIDADSLKSAAEYLVDALQDPAAVILGSCPGEGKVSLVAAFTPGVVDLGIQAGKFIGPIAKLCGGGGGGRPNFAQAGGRKPENLLSALEKARTELVSILSEKAS